MKKIDKQALAAKAFKIKENIKLPQMKFAHGKNSKEEDSQKDAALQRNLSQTGVVSGDVHRTETPQRNLYQTGVISGDVRRTETLQRNLYQTGVISRDVHRTETPQRNLYQTGVIPGGAYRAEIPQRNLYQTGVIPGGVYRAETPQRNLNQTGMISGSAYRTETPQRNLYQTGTVLNNAYSMDLPQSNNRRTQARQGTARRMRGTQGDSHQLENPQEKVRRTEGMQRRRQARPAQEDVQQKTTSQRKRRQAELPRRNGYQSGQSVKAAPRTQLSGAVAAYIKIAMVALLVLFIVLDLSDEPDSAVQIETVAENVVKAAGLQASEPAEARMVKRFYGLNPKDYEGAVLYAPVDNMDAHELFLVKLKDDTQKKTVKDAIEERLDTQLKSFEGYGAEQTALLEKHVLSVKGNYVLYIVGEYAEDAREAFAESL